MAKLRSRKIWWWSIIALVALLSVVALYQLLFKRQHYIETALLKGQRVEVELSGTKTQARVRSQDGHTLGVDEQGTSPSTLSVELLLTGLGDDPELMEKALELPNTIAFGLSANAPTLEYWAHRLTQQGRIFFIELPLYLSHEKRAVGPYDIDSRATPSQQVERMKALFASANGRKGVYMALPGRFEEYQGAFDMLFTFLSSKQVPLIYVMQERTAPSPLTEYRFSQADRYIRQGDSASLTFHQLREIAGKDRSDGSRVQRVVLEAGKESVKTVNHWLQDIQKRTDIILSPLGSMTTGDAHE